MSSPERTRTPGARAEPRLRLGCVRVWPGRVALIAVLSALSTPTAGWAASAPGLVTFPVPAHAGVTFAEAPGLGGVYALAALPDGNAVAAGLDQQGKHLAIAELLPDGSLDPAFGDGGVAMPGLPGGLRITPAAVLPEASGILMVIGVSASGLSVVRISAAGALDTSFGVQGVATIPKWTEGGVSGALAPSGGIVVAGQIEGTGELGVASLTPAGALDPGFGSGGIAILSGPNTGIVDSSVAALANGSVLDAFASTLVELSAAGDPSPSFADGGTLALPATARQILPQAGGGVLVLMPGQGVTSYSPSGAIDTTYGSGGKTSIPTVGDSFDAPDAPSSATLLPAGDGGTFVVGLDGGTTPVAVVERLTANGRYDPSPTPESQSAALPFGGGTFLEGRVVSFKQDPFADPPPFAAAVRSDGSLLLGSAVHVVAVPGPGALDSSFVTQWALAALTPMVARHELRRRKRAARQRLAATPARHRRLVAGVLPARPLHPAQLHPLRARTRRRSRQGARQAHRASERRPLHHRAEHVADRAHARRTADLESRPPFADHGAAERRGPRREHAQTAEHRDTRMSSAGRLRDTVPTRAFVSAPRHLPLLTRVAIGAASTLAALLLFAGSANGAFPAWTTYRHDAARSGIDPDSTLPLPPNARVAERDARRPASTPSRSSTGRMCTSRPRTTRSTRSTRRPARSRWEAAPRHARPELAAPVRRHRTRRRDHEHARDRPRDEDDLRRHGQLGRHHRKASATTWSRSTAAPARCARASRSTSIPRSRPAAAPRQQLQRPGLALDGEQDHHRLSAATTATATPTGAGWWRRPRAAPARCSPTRSTPSRATSQGAIWGAGNGPAVDSRGDVYVATGNGCSGGNFDYGDSVLRLESRTLQLLESWAPADWQELDNDDADLGSSDPGAAPRRTPVRDRQAGRGCPAAHERARTASAAVPAAELDVCDGSWGGGIYVPASATQPGPCM